MRLQDKVILVAGGTGSVGEGIVKHLINSGGQVIVPVRNLAKGNDLRDYLGTDARGRLYTFPADSSHVAGLEQLGEQIQQQFGRLDLVVASLGGWWQGSGLHEMPFGEWKEVVANNLSSHFLFAHVFVSRLVAQGSGTYVMINGGAAEFAVPGSGIISVMAAAQKMMAQVLATETAGTGIMVYGLGVFSPVRTRSRGQHVRPEWVSAEEIGAYVEKLYHREVREPEQFWQRLHVF